MKEIKDKFVPDHAWYFVVAYLHQTGFQPIYDRKLEKYDEKTGFPIFQMEWVNWETFKELMNEAVSYFEEHAEDITEETIDKYAEK
jgi:hypothetical protein